MDRLHGVLQELLQDHKELRRRMKDIQDYLQKVGFSNGDRLGKTAGEELYLMQKALSEAIKAHERKEERLMAATLAKPGAAAEALLKTVEGDHKTLDCLLQILDSMSDLRDQHTTYAIRFTAHSLAYALERHLDYEEKNVFPLVARTLSSALAPMEQAGTQ